MDKKSEEDDKLLESFNVSVEMKKEEKVNMQVHPTIWISLSLLVAVIYAISNISISIVAKFRIKAIALQAYGRVIGNIIPIIVVCWQEKNKKRSERKIGDEGVYFGWFKNIYYKRMRDGNGDLVENQWTNELHWDRIRGSILIGVLSTVSYAAFLLAYDWANTAGLNNGVMMSLYSMKPIFTSVLFYVFFRQTLKWFEIVAIGLCVSCAALIGLSSEQPDLDAEKEDSQKFIILACSFLLLALLLTCLRTTVVKYYFGDAPEINISAVFNVNILYIDIAFLVYFYVLTYQGFEYTWFEFACGWFGGMSFSFAQYIIAYVNIRGNAGTSDALIETCTFYQTLLDMLFFERYPNLMQYSGLVIGFGATLFLIIAHKIFG
ncbi:unnamed protein product [Moneuplotes crassus]|uniref:EamA domain-containing protein n=1 Tax=Euplotes crassus TaxID=5936 RepID=A0AAD1XI98_EUPCR|nr:unnamed protein product [Moneuplotes crassus]